MNSSQANDNKDENKNLKNNLKVKSNDDNWGAPPAKNVVLLAKKVDRYF